MCNYDHDAMVADEAEVVYSCPGCQEIQIEPSSFRFELQCGKKRHNYPGVFLPRSRGAAVGNVHPISRAQARIWANPAASGLFYTQLSQLLWQFNSIGVVSWWKYIQIQRKPQLLVRRTSGADSDRKGMAAAGVESGESFCKCREVSAERSNVKIESLHAEIFTFCAGLSGRSLLPDVDLILTLQSPCISPLKSRRVRVYGVRSTRRGRNSPEACFFSRIWQIQWS